jgi:hypothetical protein
MYSECARGENRVNSNIARLNLKFMGKISANLAKYVAAITKTYINDREVGGLLFYRPYLFRAQ